MISCLDFDGLLHGELESIFDQVNKDLLQTDLVTDQELGQLSFTEAWQKREHPTFVTVRLFELVLFVER